MKEVKNLVTCLIHFWQPRILAAQTWSILVGCHSVSEKPSSPDDLVYTNTIQIGLSSNLLGQIFPAKSAEQNLPCDVTSLRALHFLYTKQSTAHANVPGRFCLQTLPAAVRTATGTFYCTRAQYHSHSLHCFIFAMATNAFLHFASSNKHSIVDESLSRSQPFLNCIDKYTTLVPTS